MVVVGQKQKKPTMGTPSVSSSRARETSIVADSSGLLQTLQGHVEGVRAHLQCGICVRPLYEPYTLACGHTFCYGCLTSWFSSGRSHKTCPDCRAQVKDQPAPAYLVRAIVHIFTSHAELLEKGETTAEHSKNQREEASRLEADKSNDNPNNGGLFQGCFKAKPFPLDPIFDGEDGVTRCPNCAWELDEDECMNCGYHVEDGTIGDDSEDLSDMTDDDDNDDDSMEEEMDDIDDFTDYDDVWGDGYGNPIPFNLAQQLYGATHNFGPHPHFHHHHYHAQLNPFGIIPRNPFSPFSGQTDAHTSEAEPGEDGEEEDEEDDEDMESFIDDDEIEDDSQTDHSTVVGDQGSVIYEYDSGTDTTNSQGCHDNSSIADEIDEDNEDEDEDDESVRVGPSQRIQRTRSSLYAPRNFINGNINQPSSGGSQSMSAGTSANNAINVEDDSEDEMPISATRRSRLNRC